MPNPSRINLHARSSSNVYPNESDSRSSERSTKPCLDLAEHSSLYRQQLSVAFDIPQLSGNASSSGRQISHSRTSNNNNVDCGFQSQTSANSFAASPRKPRQLKKAYPAAKESPATMRFRKSDATRARRYSQGEAAFSMHTIRSG